MEAIKVSPSHTDSMQVVDPESYSHPTGSLLFAWAASGFRPRAPDSKPSIHALLSAIQNSHCRITKGAFTH